MKFNVAMFMSEKYLKIFQYLYKNVYRSWYSPKNWRILKYFHLNILPILWDDGPLREVSEKQKSKESQIKN